MNRAILDLIIKKIAAMSRSLCILVFVCLAFICGCDKKVKRALVVGTAADYPPFTFIHGNNTVTGFDIDLATALSKKLGYKLIIKNLQFDELIPALQGHKIDFAIAAITATRARSQLVDFSANYHSPKLALLYKQQNPIPSNLSLDYKTIAVQRGSTMEKFLENRLHLSVNARMLRFGKIPIALAELKVGQVDCIFIELIAAKAFCEADINLAYAYMQSHHTVNYAIAFPKGSKLRREFDNAMLKLKVSNEFDQLKEKWIEQVNQETTIQPIVTQH